MLVETKIDGELFTHRLLWSCCERQVKTAETEQRGNLYYELTAMLMAYLTYEAYLNFIGDRLFPQIWQDEKKFFNKNPYKGTEGKLKYIIKQLNLSKVDAGKRPYQTIKKLEELRDFLSHGKVIKYKKVIKHHRNQEPPLFYSIKKELFKNINIQRSIEDIKSFIEELHSKIRPHVEDPFFGDMALKGFSEYSTGSSSKL